MDGPGRGKRALPEPARSVPSEALWQLDRLELFDITAQFQHGIKRFRRRTPDAESKPRPQARRRGNLHFGRRAPVSHLGEADDGVPIGLDDPVPLAFGDRGKGQRWFSVVWPRIVLTLKYTAACTREVGFAGDNSDGQHGPSGQPAGADATDDSGGGLLRPRLRGGWLGWPGFGWGR